jgi:riboflavin kinase/FMN adenylyltransferase
MIVVRSLQEITYQEASVVTVGTFDGIHRGHQKILETVLEHGKSKDLRTVVVTFDPHPRTIVGRGPVLLLTTLEERLRLFEQYGIHMVFIVHFTYEFSRLTSRDFFFKYVVDGIGAREVIIGHDHMFGRDREAGIEEIRKLSKDCSILSTIVEPVMIDQQIVSSSNIRELLLRGEVERVQQFLHRHYILTGRVVRGDARGAGMGFPTANLEMVDEIKVVPANGVYLVEVEIERKIYFGMMNIGVRPTFNQTNRTILEVHLFNFTGILYDKNITIQFLRRLREERKFSSKEALIQQLQHDRLEAMKLISELTLSTVN